MVERQHDFFDLVHVMYARILAYVYPYRLIRKVRSLTSLPLAVLERWKNFRAPWYGLSSFDSTGIKISSVLMRLLNNQF